ncbi:hypothetical protein [Marinirhabdus gelatinilytica]|uniref:Uncharacterized protein n=1 Tax=Marinirhabdus gelatinilytica TaxID=1703343 RepID=A0A370Q577_9FLAO|nr:hypothetical protein [Marinirhabdus gelatinilytica]RDK83492.1 hypothetical protein C8D94_10729 [Marinirhabdus gelatinilytica]
MNKQNNKSKIPTFRKQAKSNLVYGGLIVFILAITPFIFYSYESFPSDSKTWETFLFTISTEYTSFQHLAWYSISKLIPIILLLVWFFTCKHWWHWIIIVPLAMYSFQFFSIIQQSYGIDEVELIYLIPLLMILVPSVYLIRAKLFAKVRGNDLEKFEEELASKRSFWQQIKELFK